MNVHAEAALDMAENSNGLTALMAACATGQEACVRLLIDVKAEVDVAQSDGMTALMAAS